MLQLASHYGKGPIDLKEIAKKEAISLKYLEQLIIPLRTAGLVKSARGSKGGYFLAKPPSEICLYDLVKALDGPIRLIDCLNDPKGCPRSTTCVMRDIWNDVSEAMDKIFRSVTLEELVYRMREKEDGNLWPMYQI